MINFNESSRNKIEIKYSSFNDNFDYSDHLWTLPSYEARLDLVDTLGADKSYTHRYINIVPKERSLEKEGDFLSKIG